MSTSEDVERLVAPAVASAGLELVDVELIANPRVVRISVDGADGVDLDGLGPLAKDISRLLDEADAVPGGHYDLEVSSPGLERTLRRREHFSKAVGARVRLRTRPGADGNRRAEGVLVAADEHGIEVDAGAGEPPRQIAYEDIERARTVFDWQAALAAAPPRPERPRRERPRRAPADPRTNEADPGRERAPTQ